MTVPAVAELEVLSIDGVPPRTRLSGRFSLAGGSIGRAADNTLCLDDRSQQVSRVHARLVCRSGQLRLIALGRAGLLVEQAHLEMGEESPITDGTRIGIGPFLLRAKVFSLPQAAPASDPASASDRQEPLP